MNAYMMREFSQRTIDGLKEYKLFRIILPPFKSFLEVNLDKEIDKHREVINYAMEAVVEGHPPGTVYIERLLQRAREIDRIFLQKAQMFSSAIDIHYHEIDPIRQRRFEYLLEANYRILIKWRDLGQVRKAICNLYEREQFRLFLLEILNLYIKETRLLSHSVRIPRRLSAVRTTLIDTVDRVMKNIAAELVIDLTDKVYK